MLNLFGGGFEVRGVFRLEFLIYEDQMPLRLREPLLSDKILNVFL